MSEDEEAPSNWTIKSVPPAVRKEALRCAQALGQSVAQWLAEGIPKLAAIQSGDRVEMPGR